MRVFRLTKQKFVDEFNGKGAAKFGNRWNSKGVEIIYCAQSRALAMAEVAVHLTFATLPSNYLMMEIEIPDAVIISELNLNVLSKNWNSFPHISETQKIGDGFINEKKACVFKVPSAVVKGDFNFLINPFHSDFEKIKIETISDFPFDRRLFA